MGRHPLPADAEEADGEEDGARPVEEGVERGQGRDIGSPPELHLSAHQHESHRHEHEHREQTNTREEQPLFRCAAEQSGFHHAANSVVESGLISQ